MSFPLVIICNDGIEIHININKINFITAARDGGGYDVHFDKEIIHLDYKQYRKLKEAFEHVVENQ